VLLQAAVAAGLDADQARAVLASDAYTQEVRAEQQLYLNSGIASVPAVIINNQYLISGGQPVEVFAQALRQISQQAAAA
jgi:predicted DsbA family dithiol-disulfide isomerase